MLGCMPGVTDPLGIDAPGIAESRALREAHDADGALTRTRPTPAAAFHAARRMFLKGRRVDMRALAAELGIARPTLYRWTGQREQLLSDVLWSLSDEIFQRARQEHPRHEGAKRLLAIYRKHVGALVEAQPLHVFLRQETQVALRVLTSPFLVFRPFPWEVNSAQTLIASAEGMFLLGLFWINRRSLRFSVTHWRAHPFIGFILVFSAETAIALSCAFSNFGLIARERVMFTPLLLMLVVAFPAQQWAAKSSVRRPMAFGVSQA